MITIDGGFVKLIHQEADTNNGRVVVIMQAKMFYIDDVAKRNLEQELSKLGYKKDYRYDEWGDPEEEDEDIRVRRVEIEPFAKEEMN